MHHIKLNIVSQTGETHLTVIPLNKIHKSHSEASPNDILVYSEGIGGTYMTEYKVESLQDHLMEYHNITYSSSLSHQNEENNSLERSDTSEILSFIHQDHKIEIQIWSNDKCVDIIQTNPVSSLETDRVDYADILKFPENSYGLIGISYCQRRELYDVGTIYVTPNKMDSFKKTEEIEKQY
jgi:hypothetical protein